MLFHAALAVDGEYEPDETGDSVPAEVAELFARRPTSSSDLPDPTPLILNLTRCAIEILAGARELAQIARWVEQDVYDALARRAAIAARARRQAGRRVTRPAVAIGSCHIARPADGVVEACAIVHVAPRTRAVTLRLVGVDGRWRAAHLAVL